MDTTIAAPASCEARAVIGFLHAEGQNVADIHRRLYRVYGDNVMSDSCVREWCRNSGMGALMCMTKVVKDDTQL
jgi:hypothetical protein